ncbi:hypothetical protein TEA_019892 [Camellia sinensis var. sinensis]|uniref:Uncharacterized protein n=1 Tax=Camellia sinensis var. sinensis TaxID=542762 RepID=A0A4S4CZV1_CAMSN|nr:hypothetical protein TEA_019892 [Camellia sinensis var. sinensis]
MKTYGFQKKMKKKIEKMEKKCKQSLAIACDRDISQSDSISFELNPLKQGKARVDRYQTVLTNGRRAGSLAINSLQLQLQLQLQLDGISDAWSSGEHSAQCPSQEASRRYFSTPLSSQKRLICYFGRITVDSSHLRLRSSSEGGFFG